MLAHADTCAELIFSGNFRMYFYVNILTIRTSCGIVSVEQLIESGGDTVGARPVTLYYTGGIDCETFYLCLFVLFVDSYCSIR